MTELWRRVWWAVLLRGLAFLAFGLVAFFWTGITLAVLILLAGANFVVDGIMMLLVGLRDRKANDAWWAYAIYGLIGVIAGISTFVWPGLTAVVLLYLIAAWAILSGLFETIAALRLRRVIEDEALMILNGLVSMLLGILLIVNPGDGALALVKIIGVFAAFAGIILILLAMNLRNFSKKTQLPQIE